MALSKKSIAAIIAGSIMTASLSVFSTSLSIATYAILDKERNTVVQGDKGDKGDKGDQGIQGQPGTNGADGVSIVSITLTSSVGLVDTYTITYSDGTTSTFTVTNGEKGEQGIQGQPGTNGHTPVITIGSNGNWFVDGVDTGISAKGAKGDDGVSIVSIELTSSSGLVDTYTITYSDGTTSTFTVTNGEKGEQGEQGIQGQPGTNGHTPVVTIGSNGNWYVDGVDTGISAKGDKGDKGDDGEDAPHAGEKHTVTYHLKGGEMPTGYENSVEVNWGDTLDLPIPTKDGYDFLGWFTGDTVNDKQFYSTDAVFRDLDLTAKWTEHIFTLTLDVNGGEYSGDTTMQIKYTDTFTLPHAEITHETKIFGGWYRLGAKSKFEDKFFYTEDVTLKAKWLGLNYYYTTLDLKGGTGVDSEDLSQTFTNDDVLNNGFTLPVPSREGFTFLGYYFQSNQVTDESGEIVNLPVWSTCTLEAKWECTDGTTLGDYITMGSYPQSVVEDPAIKDALEEATDTDGNGWLNYNDEEYLKFTCDAFNTGYLSTTGMTTFKRDKSYYFKVEPIQWKILSGAGTTGGIVMTNKIMRGISYYGSSQDRQLDGETIYANNYEYSNLRAWLNGYNLHETFSSDYYSLDYTDVGFYDLAFSSSEKAKIATTLVDNSLTTTGNSTNSYVCNDTNDKLFVLSYSDLINPSFGFDSSDYAYDYARQFRVTDFAVASGTLVNADPDLYYPYGTAQIWTRSPANNKSTSARRVEAAGDISQKDYVYQKAMGVVPAMTLDID